jgi:cell division protein FtsL
MEIDLCDKQNNIEELNDRLQNMQHSLDMSKTSCEKLSSENEAMKITFEQTKLENSNLKETMKL